MAEPTTPASPMSAGQAGSERVFAALLKYWRGQRGMSQLDLSLVAEVSARHISFLETGRSKPSAGMVLVLADALAVPMRDTNELLRAAGFAARFPEPTIDNLLDGALGQAVDLMLRHHEPFPMMVVDRLHNVLRTNRAGVILFAIADIEIETDESGHGKADDVNVMRLLFDPASREMFGDWETTASTLLRCFQREVFHRPHDQEMAHLLDELISAPGVPEDWRQQDLTETDEPMVGITFRAGDIELNFLTTITEFKAPQNVTLEELRIDSYFPLDDQTRTLCEQLLA